MAMPRRADMMMPRRANVTVLKRVSMIRHWRRARAGRERRATVVVEFALLAPVLILFTIGVLDISKAMIIYQQVENAAHTITISASNLAVQPDGSTSLSVTDAQQVMSAIYAEMPLVAAGVEKGVRSATLTSVTFVQADPACVPLAGVTCASTPFPAWSVGYTGGTPGGFTVVTRPCGALTQVAATAATAGNLTLLPTLGIANPGPVLVADVHYRFSPTFFAFVTGPIDFWASSFWPVRSVASAGQGAPIYTQYDIANQAGGTGKCAGF